MRKFFEIASHVSIGVALVSAVIMVAGDLSLVPKRLLQSPLVEYSEIFAVGLVALTFLADYLAVRIPGGRLHHLDMESATLLLVGWLILPAVGFTSILLTVYEGWNTAWKLGVVAALVLSAIAIAMGLIELRKPMHTAR